MPIESRMGPCGFIFLFGLAFPTRIRGEQLYVFSFDSNLTGCKAAIFGQHTYDMRLETFHGDSTTEFQSIIEGNDSNIISYQGQQAFNSYSNGFYVALDPRCRSLCNPKFLTLSFPRNHQSYLIGDSKFSVISLGGFTCKAEVPKIGLYDDRNVNYAIPSILIPIVIIKTCTLIMYLCRRTDLLNILKRNSDKASTCLNTNRTPATIRKLPKRKVGSENDGIDARVIDQLIPLTAHYEAVKEVQSGLEFHNALRDLTQMQSLVLPEDNTLELDDHEWKEWIKHNVYMK